MSRPVSITMIAALALLGATTQGGQPEQLAPQLLENINAIQQLRKEHLSTRDAHRAKQVALEEQGARLRQTRQELLDEVNLLETELRRLREELETDEEATDNGHRWISQVSDAAVTGLDRCEVRLAHGIPHESSGRLRELMQINSGLKSASVSIRADNLRRAFDFYGREFRLAHITEIVNDSVKVSQDRELPAYLLRLGLVGQWFMTEDRSDVGVCDPSTPSAYRLISNRKELKRVLDAFDVMRGRRTPQMVTLKLPLPSEPANGESPR